ncbi:MAG: type II toxin-antitoxin system RelE/ParE family toxin [Proteobacteria bacterium]|nr:type II toxin-antitoxin system RelE/ParE family toxin [Pseudomonadota bacterium]
MHTVIETPSFQKAAAKAGLGPADIDEIVTQIAKAPRSGDLIQGSGGCRKVRVAGRGKGKSGGYRLITFYHSGDHPVFLLTVYSKGEMGNLSDAQVNVLRNIVKAIVR